jgi:hypothetical protein
MLLNRWLRRQAVMSLYIPKKGRRRIRRSTARLTLLAKLVLLGSIALLVLAATLVALLF